jgi:hypothetical protein
MSRIEEIRQHVADPKTFYAVGVAGQLMPRVALCDVEDALRDRDQQAAVADRRLEQVLRLSAALLHIREEYDAGCRGPLCEERWFEYANEALSGESGIDSQLTRQREVIDKLIAGLEEIAREGDLWSADWARHVIDEARRAEGGA